MPKEYYVLSPKLARKLRQLERQATKVREAVALIYPDEEADHILEVKQFRKTASRLFRASDRVTMLAAHLLHGNFKREKK